MLTVLAIWEKQKLKTLKQQTSEGVEAFAERINEMATEAYGGEINVVQRELHNIFTDGITDSGIAKRIIPGRSDTLQAALAIAKEEQLTTKTFNLRCREEPIDVNLAEQKMRDIKVSHLQHSFAAMATKLDEVLAISGQSQGQQTAPWPNRNNYAGRPHNAQAKHWADSRKWTDDSRPIGLYCDKPGHINRECRKRRADLQQAGN